MALADTSRAGRAVIRCDVHFIWTYGKQNRPWELCTCYIVPRPVINKSLLKSSQLINVHWITVFKYSITWGSSLCLYSHSFGGLLVIQVVITFSTVWHISVLLLLIELFGWSAALRKKKKERQKSVSYKLHLLSSFVWALESGLALAPHPKPPTKSLSYFYRLLHARLYGFWNYAQTRQCLHK